MSDLRLSSVAAVVVAVILGSGWASLSGQTITKLEVRLAETESAPGLTEASVFESGQRIYLHGEVIVTNSDIAGARVVPGNDGSGFNVAVAFNNGGSEKMAKATQGHLNRPIAILIDGQVVAAPVLRGSISADAVITGSFSSARAAAIASGLNAR